MWSFLGAYCARVLKGDANSGPMFPAQRRSNEEKNPNNNNHLIITRHDLRE
jgi:hypothetical protein